MRITYDPGKSDRNITLRGLSFERAKEFDFETAVNWIDTRKDYGELRIGAIGWLGDRLHAVTYTLRDDEIRVISFRKANARERKKYEKKAS